ncbi:MAG TPA: type II CAAX endopeptidase family protein [candidate division Zixibacteria bacterium]
MPVFNFALFAQFGPSLAAIFLIASYEGKEGLKRTLKSIINWQVGWGWILLAASFELVLFLGFTGIYWYRYKELQVMSGFNLATGITSLVGTFIVGLFRWGLAEEIGWRGWMFPKLQSRMSPFKASMILAVVVSLWHLDPYSLSKILSPQNGMYIAGYYPAVVERLIISIPITLVITYIFNNTKGSLLPMIIFHSTSNTSYFWVEDVFRITQTEFFKTLFLLAMLALMMPFSILVIKQRKKVLSQKSTETGSGALCS